MNKDGPRKRALPGTWSWDKALQTALDPAPSGASPEPHLECQTPLPCRLINGLESTVAGRSARTPWTNNKSCNDFPAQLFLFHINHIVKVSGSVSDIFLA